MNRLVAAAALTGFCGVAFGAFGAHALDGQLTDEARGWWTTATTYALPHAAAALAAGLAARSSRIRLGGWLLVCGAVIFAASLYAMALGGPRVLGAVTPLGGLSMLAGWLMLALGAAGRDQDPADPSPT
ncbi:MAG: DUF423 domain-containing protein [Acidobacteria bacterium]|jgi:uncharacterized membrane protein YgdD (TMEM256/DUF423 family)|nr:DUF423 domain-containing protein [Acidobacteriota bacterium]